MEAEDEGEREDEALGSFQHLHLQQSFFSYQAITRRVDNRKSISMDDVMKKTFCHNRNHLIIREFKHKLAYWQMHPIECRLI